MTVSVNGTAVRLTTVELCLQLGAGRREPVATRGIELRDLPEARDPHNTVRAQRVFSVLEREHTRIELCIGGIVQTSWRQTARRFGDTARADTVLDHLAERLPPDDWAQVVGEATVEYGGVTLKFPAAYLVSVTGFYAARDGMFRTKTIHVPAQDIPKHSKHGVSGTGPPWTYDCQTTKGPLTVYLHEPTAAEAIKDAMDRACIAVREGFAFRPPESTETPGDD